MRKLKITILIMALLVLTTQAVRHVYVRYLEPRTSVLDKFEETEAKKVIQNAAALSDIVKEYEPARKRVDQLNEEMKKELFGKPNNEYYILETKYREDHKQEYE